MGVAGIFFRLILMPMLAVRFEYQAVRRNRKIRPLGPDANIEGVLDTCLRQQIGKNLFDVRISSTLRLFGKDRIWVLVRIFRVVNLHSLAMFGI